MPDPFDISAVVSSFYSELRTVAADLNAVSDELGKSIAEIDAVLKNLNLGITVWTDMNSGQGNPDRGDETYWSEDIGYAKFSGRWGICLRKVEGDTGCDEQSEETWLFNDAPRKLRLSAIDHIVKLLQKLSEEGQATAQEIKEKLADAQEVATAVTQAARRSTVPEKKVETAHGKLFQATKDAPLGGLR